MQRYTYDGPVDESVPIDVSLLKDTSVVLTGGANGIGAVCVREFVAAGAFVTFSDLDVESGKALEADLNQTGPRCAFVRCDVCDWDQQKIMFETAKSRSPKNTVDIVCANAGISRGAGDSLWVLDDTEKEPVKPRLKTVEVNLIGSLYTFKLAVHYWRQQSENASIGRSFMFTGSMATFIDSPGNWEYTASKYGMRGFMRVARRNTHEQGIRIVHIAPQFTRSAIRTKEYEAYLVGQGVEFAEPEDVAKCMLRVATDKSINGRTFAIVPRTVKPEGYMDVDREDYKEGVPEDEYLKGLQALQLKIIKDTWQEGGSVRGLGTLHAKKQ